MSLASTVGIAKVGTKSLRATVPEGIVVYLGIKAGDKLEWRMEIENGKRIAIVNKLQHPNDEADKIAKKYGKSKEK